MIAQADDSLGTVPGAGDPGEALWAFNPSQPGYVALRDKLADLRAAAVGSEARNPIPAGRPLKLGMSDIRVPLIRARFGLGLVSGDHVALLAENRIEWPVVQLAVSRAGMVLVPLNSHAPPP